MLMNPTIPDLPQLCWLELPLSAAPSSNASYYKSQDSNQGTARWGLAIRHAKTGHLRSPDSLADRIEAAVFLSRIGTATRPWLACAAQGLSFLPLQGISYDISAYSPSGNTYCVLLQRDGPICHRATPELDWDLASSLSWEKPRQQWTN